MFDPIQKELIRKKGIKYVNTRLLLFYILRDSDNVISVRKNKNTEHPNSFSIENRLFSLKKKIIAYSMMLPRFDHRVCFSRANFIAGPPSSAQSHRPLRFAPRRRHARRIGLATAECAVGSFSGPALEEDDGGGSQKKTQVVSLN